MFRIASVTTKVPADCVRSGCVGTKPRGPSPALAAFDLCGFSTWAM